MQDSLSEILWRLYRRPDPPRPWLDDGNLPWNDPAFSERMLREHLDESHGAASRTTAERTLQLAWLWDKLGLASDMRVFDVTCGPGLYAVSLAERGCEVTGVDFSPASIAYARDLAQTHGVADRCRFVEADVRTIDYAGSAFDAALFLYGQLAVFPRETAAELLAMVAAALRPGARLAVELLNQARVDKSHSTWWYTDDKGLWGDRPYLHLGERHWLADEQISVERFTIIDLETAVASEITLCDQTYAPDEMAAMLRTAGFGQVDIYPAWDDVALYDAAEWVVFVATK